MYPPALRYLHYPWIIFLALA